MRPPGKLICPAWFLSCVARWVSSTVSPDSRSMRGMSTAAGIGLGRKEAAIPAGLLRREAGQQPSRLGMAAARSRRGAGECGRASRTGRSPSSAAARAALDAAPV